MGVDHDLSIVYFWSSSGDDVDCLCLIISSTVAVCDWCILIVAVVVNDWTTSILIVLTIQSVVFGLHKRVKKVHHCLYLLTQLAPNAVSHIFEGENFPGKHVPGTPILISKTLMWFRRENILFQILGFIATRRRFLKTLACLPRGSHMEFTLE